MVAIREWLADHSNQEFFSFNRADFDQDCEEILEGYVEADDPVSEDAYRTDCWQLLQSWQRDREYLASLNLHRLIARHVRNSCKKARTSTSIESWVELALESSRQVASQLVYEIENAIRATWKVRAPWRADAVPKFSEKLSLESLDKFHLGLENFIGYPPTNSDFLELMKREHEKGEVFQYQEGRDVDPKVEWNIVMGSEAWNITGAGCDPSFEIKKRVIGKPLDFYIQEAKRVFSEAWAVGEKNETLIDAEVAALRLWTGPMHKEYAEELRNPTKPNGPYITTLHSLNSGITKLARIWRLPASRKVYRGYQNLSLKELKKDAFQCVGGVEKSVLATSEEFNIAAQYSGDGAFILELDVGQVNRGADVSWLSQFPHEKEILFNALSNVEFLCSPQLRFVEGRGTILVYQVCVSANVKSKTLEEFVRLRKDLHVNLVDVLTQEVRRVIYLREEFSKYGVIKRLCAECRNQCDCILNEAHEAVVSVFNEGRPAYLVLVEDAILLQSRAFQIIDLALHWFDSGEVDPSTLDGMQDWQVEALRTAFRSGGVRQVQKIVLEQVRVITGLFTAESLDLGAFQNVETVCKTAKLLTLNPNLNDLKIEVASATAEVWEQVFKQLCPGRPRLCVNGVFLGEYAAVNMLQQLELRTLDIQVAAMIPPALQIHTPTALTSLSLLGSPIGCIGAESLSRAVGNMQRLRYVDLRSCMIADRGCTGISHSLPALTELEELNLAHNHVKDDGFNILATLIQRFGLSRLKTVDMRCNDTQLPRLRCGAQCVMRTNFLSKVSNDVRISCAAWFSGGDQIASALFNGTIIIWDEKTGEQVLTLRGHTREVLCVAWRPGGDQIVSGGGERGSRGEVIIWDAKTGKQISSLKGHTNLVTSVAWRQGDQIASASGDKTVIFWDAKTGEQVSTLRGHTEWVTSVAWRLGGDQLASGSYDNTIIIWDAKTGEQISTLKGHTSAVFSVAWRPGGDQIASGSLDGTVIIWDAKTGEQVSMSKRHTSAVTSVAWRPERPDHPWGDQIASAFCDGTVVIWDAKAGDQVLTLKGHTGPVTSVDWLPRGDQIASASEDKTIIIWDVKTCEQVSMLKGHIREVTCVAWRTGSDLIASASHDKTIIIWDAKTGEQVSTLKGHTSRVNSVAWRPGGDHIVSGGCGHGNAWVSRDNPGIIIIWDAKTGDQVAVLKGHSGAVWSVAWSPGGGQVASGSYDNTIIIWDAKTGEQVSTLKGHTHFVTSVAWRPGGGQVASGSLDNTIIIWDAKTGKHVSTLKGHTSYVNSVAWRPGGDQIASGSLDNTVIIWDAKTGEQVSTLKGHTSEVYSVAWRPGGDQIASGSGDKTIIIWDAKTGEQVSTLKGHNSGVMSVTWRHGGDQIASGSCDNTIMLWDAKKT